MASYLFRQSISVFTDQRIREARTQVEQLTDAQLEDPSLAGKLDEIANVKFVPARLLPEQRKGKRRTEKRKVNDYGREVMIDVDIIDVAIPFEGWPKSFDLAPSSCTIIDTPATITGERAIQISLSDDQNLDRNVDSFIQHVSNNLNTLKKELEALGPRIRQEVQLIADQRLQRIRERRKRDKTRSFPIE